MFTGETGSESISLSATQPGEGAESEIDSDPVSGFDIDQADELTN
jgi:hypothetical protein